MTWESGIVLWTSNWNITQLLWWLNENYIIKWIIVLFAFWWIVSVIRVIKDISHRTNSTFLQIISILLVTLFTPVIWLPLYKLIRPVYMKYDLIPWREALVSDLIECRNCWWLNKKENDCCIFCWDELKIKCKECWNSFSYNNKYCNKCWLPNLQEFEKDK